MFLRKYCHLCYKNIKIPLNCDAPTKVINRYLNATGKLMMKKDYYEILELQRNAHLKDIKTAYFKLAKKYHPDSNDRTNDDRFDADKRFYDVSEAYRILSDPQRKLEFDNEQSRAAANESGIEPESSKFESFHSSVDPHEMYNKIFGAMPKDSGKWRPLAWIDFAEGRHGHAPAQEVTVPLTFKEAIKGCYKNVSFNVLCACYKCDGSRTQLGYASQICPFCNGSGLETITDGPIVVRSSCRTCKGTGLYIQNPCTECLGHGMVVIRKSADIPIPPLTEDRNTMRVEIEGNELFITFRVTESKYFRRDGYDIHTDVSICMSQAILGGHVKIEGLYGNEDICIPSGTSSHDVIRLYGKGLTKNNANSFGDHFIHIKINVPKNLSSKMKTLMKSFAQIEHLSNGVNSNEINKHVSKSVSREYCLGTQCSNGKCGKH